MDQELISTAARALGIQGVHLRESEVRCKRGFHPPFIEASLSLIPQYRGGVDGRFELISANLEETGEPVRVVLFHFNAGVRLVDAEQADGGELADDHVYLELTARFCAQYQVDAEADTDALGPALNEFALYNVGYHVWPYWREYVQATCARIGIPPIPIPMYRISKESVEQESSD